MDKMSDIRGSKVIKFRKKNEIPIDIQRRIDNIADEFHGVMLDAMRRIGNISIDNVDEINKEEFDRVYDLMMKAFWDSLTMTK